MKRSLLLGIVVALAVPRHSVVFAAPDDWAEGSAEHNDGANHTYYNRAGQLAWRNREGDWRDAAGERQGAKPFAVTATDDSRPLEWDLTSLVRAWAAGKERNKGVLLRNVQSAGNCIFHSREAADSAVRPRLEVVVGGKRRNFEATADTYLERSTYRGQGNRTTLRVDGSLPALIRFDLGDLKSSDVIEKATLVLTAVKRYAAGQIGVFVCDQGEEVSPAEPRFGLAAKYPGDQGIERDADVYFFADFQADDWRNSWSQVGGKVDAVEAHSENKFEPLAGRACRVYLEKGELTAMNQTLQFQKQYGLEPEEIYFRYYLRLGDDWHQTVQGGKMPGISGTYGRAGWGGRKVNGKDGWSARGQFFLEVPAGNPLAGKQPLGWYCYHADMEGYYGSGWVWNHGYRGFIDNNRWYCIEEYLKLNTPGTSGEKGANDGVLRAWIDGRLAHEKADVRFRDVAELKIEQIWMNVYHGGTIASPRDQHLYVDNVVVAKQYIGPCREFTAQR